MKRVLKMLAPYISVGIFWCIFKNGWLAILGYHAQALLWRMPRLSDLEKPKLTRTAWLVAPASIGGPLVFFMLPYISRVDLAQWLADYGVSGVSLAIMVPYFGIIHPIIEQHHWARLRARTPFAHFAFAGYHMMVLYSLLNIPGMILCFGVLVTVSFIWHQMTRRSGGIILAAASHIAADLGIVIIGWAIATYGA